MSGLSLTCAIAAPDQPFAWSKQGFRHFTEQNTGSAFSYFEWSLKNI